MSSDPSAIQVYAAGSLRHVLPALVSAFSARTGVAVETRHGPAGLLRERIEQGDRPDLFLSASIDHPARLAGLGLSGPPVVFARNTMAAAVRHAAKMITDNFVDRLLDPTVRIGTSTPLKDPSGDYAWAIFRRIDQMRPGAFELLDAKAIKLVGATETVPTLRPYDPVSDGLADGSIDIFLGYLTGLKSLVAELPDVEIVDVPPQVSVVPEYGLAAIENCRPQALSFALFVMSAAGQLLLRQFGFTPVALPQQA